MFLTSYLFLSLLDNLLQLHSLPVSFSLSFLIRLSSSFLFYQFIFLFVPHFLPICHLLFLSSSVHFLHFSFLADFPQFLILLPFSFFQSFSLSLSIHQFVFLHSLILNYVFLCFSHYLLISLNFYLNQTLLQHLSLSICVAS